MRSFQAYGVWYKGGRPQEIGVGLLRPCGQYFPLNLFFWYVNVRVTKVADWVLDPVEVALKMRWP